MLTPQLPLDAYRADLAAATAHRAFGRHDGLWLLVAELLVRGGRARGDGGADGMRSIVRDATPLLRALSDANDGPPRSDRTSSDAARSAEPLASEPVVDGERAGGFSDAIAHVIDRVEEAGALRLATAMLVALHDLVAPHVDLPRRGQLVARRARVARKLGAFDTAHDLYDHVVRIGRAARDPALAARGLIGQAVVARRRGNYPAARALYTRALSTARRGGDRALVGLAHQGLLVTAGAAGDVDMALRHGWSALAHLTDNSAAQADVLGNLAAVAAVAGHHRAALEGYLAAARRSMSSRVRLPALAGAAVAAAHLRDRDRLEAATRRIEVELTGGGLPYEHAHALTALADAWSIAQPEAAGEPFRERASALVRAGGFHELAFELESIAARRAATPDAASVAAPQRVPASSRRVLVSIESLGSEPDDAHAAYLVPMI